MFKKFLLALVVALPFCAFAQAPKFGVVDVEGIIPKMAEFVEAQNKIGEASKTFESEYAKINEELQKKYAEFQELEKDPSTLQSIQELDKKAQQFAQTAQQDLQRQQAQLMQPIQEKVMNAIKSVGTENGFTMIFPEGVPAFVSTDVQDVTALVKAKLGVKE